MTRNILRTTTALALSLALTAPNAVIGADAARGFAAGAFQIAQSDNAGKSEKSKDRRNKKANAESCADGSEPPCAEDEAAAEAPEGDAAAADAPGQAKKDEAATESAEEKPAEEAKTEEAAATEAEAETTAETTAEAPAGAATEAQVEAPEDAPASVTESSEPKQEAPAAAADKPEKKKKKEARKADAAKQDAEQPASEKASETAPAPTDDVKPEENREAATGEAPKSEETAAEAAPEKEETKAPEVVEKDHEQPKAAAADEDAAPVGVTSETVTEETTRTSDEEVPVAKSGGGKKKDDSDDLAKILGAAAGGVVVGVLLNEAFGGGKVVESTGDRVVIERDGEYIVRKDENEILRRPGSTVRNETFSDGSSRTIVDRENGVQVVTIRDAEGYVVRRSRIMPDGEEILLFDDTRDRRETRRVRIEEEEYPRYDRTVPHRRYVDYGDADRRELQDVLRTRPIAEFNRSYSLRQVREDERVREAMPRLDLDVLTFDTGSAAISRRQARNLDPLGWAMQDFIRENPDEVFLIEGHTDAVGSRYSNLILSDRRAEAVALALTEYYDIPPENLITQGYGEEFLKIETERAERANRRAAVRRITPLLDRTAARR